MKKQDRETYEYHSLFSDERYAKKAWKTIIGKSLESPAADLGKFYDRDGNETKESAIYNKAIEQVRKRLKAEGLDREPMKAEIMIECNIIKASFDNSTLNTILDRTAGKVKEEINVTSGTYETLSDEELELLIQHRNKELEYNGDVE